MTYGTGIKPGDIWVDVANDYVFIVDFKPDSYDWYIEYWNGSSYHYVTHFAIHEDDLVALIHRQDDDWTEIPAKDVEITYLDGTTKTLPNANVYYQPLRDWEVAILNAEANALVNEARSGYVTKDSGQREVRDSGYARDTEDGKARYDLLFPLGVPYASQFLTRVAELLARGAKKYEARNWELADDEASLDRYKSSAARHFAQWISGDMDEDHASAVVFNLLGHETLRYKLDQDD